MMAAYFIVEFPSPANRFLNFPKIVYKTMFLNNFTILTDSEGEIGVNVIK